MFDDKSPNSLLGEISIEKSNFFKLELIFFQKNFFPKLNITFVLKTLDTTFKNYKDQKIFCEY